ncbi:MAG: hypothetical protein VKN83_09580 [Cyanobacteriota bacterium]|nr:hypothetical protein [Cyanobacteriota bacterium]
MPPSPVAAKALFSMAMPRLDRGAVPGWRRGGRLTWVATLLLLAVVASGCQRGPSAESQRLDRVDLRIQQLEQRLNKLSARAEDGADKAGKPPAGVIKSLTLRMGTEDDRLRIYWADGSKTDLPCTKEQSTFVCG